jgi:Ras-related protein Rab-5C
MLTTVKKDAINYKCVLVGDSAVGKSSVAHRYISDDFYEFQEPTIGAAFMAKKINIDDREIRLEIWDTAGQERYRSLAPMYYRNASVAIVIYDITQVSSFEGAKSWIKEISKRAKSNCMIVLLGNKSDLENERKIDENEVNTYIENKNILHFKTSAKTGLNIKRIFNTIINKLLDSDSEGIVKKNINIKQVKNKNCCY